MKLFKLTTLSIVLLTIFSGCVSQPKPEVKVKVDNTLPLVKLTKNGTFVDMNAIAFEWSSMDDERVKGIHIYKQVINEQKSKLKYHATLNNRFATHYVDTKVKPDTAYNYSFKSFSKDAESKMSMAKVVNTLPVLQSVSWIQSIQNMPRSAKIIWRPHTNKKVQLYIIERKTLEDNQWTELAKVDSRLNAEYIDEDLKDNFIYKYRVRVKTFDNIISSPSEIVKVVTKSLPISVKDIKTTKNLPKKIEIRWKKTKTEDFDRYNLYRADASDGSYKVIAKLYNNIFVDTIEDDGKIYFYRVSAVEKNGLESIHDKNSVQGMTLVQPKTPMLSSIRLIDGQIELRWENDDIRAKNYTVIKKSKKGWFDAKVEEIVNIKGMKFIDEEIAPNMTYIYQVYALDKFSIKSVPSIETEIITPKSILGNSIKKVLKTKKQKKHIRNKVSNGSKIEEVITPMKDI